MCCLGTGSSCPTVSFASESKINYSFGISAVGLSTIQYRQRGYPFSGTHEFKNICNQLRIFRAILRPRGRFEESFKPFKFHICLCHYGMSLFWDIVSKRSLMVQPWCCNSLIPSVRWSLHVRFINILGCFNIRFVSRQLSLRDFGCSLSAWPMTRSFRPPGAF